MANILLIHGAYQGGWIWSRCAAELRARGHSVYAPTLDGCAERSHLLRAGISTESHAGELAQLMFYEDLSEAIAVGTSTGGMVLAKLAEIARERMAKLVFADALALFDGEALPDIVTRKNAVTTDLATGPTEADLRGRLFADVPASLKDWAVERTTPHPLGVMTEPVSLPTFWTQSWQARVVWCRRSQNPPEAHLRRAANALDASWGEIDCGHYPMLEQPAELATQILA